MAAGLVGNSAPEPHRPPQSQSSQSCPTQAWEVSPGLIDVDVVARGQDDSIRWLHHSTNNRWERVYGALDSFQKVKLQDLPEYQETDRGWTFVRRETPSPSPGAPEFLEVLALVSPESRETLASALRKSYPVTCTAAALPQLPKDVPPVERYYASPGILVDRVGSNVKITGILELSGVGATRELAASIQYAINNEWSKDFGHGYSIGCSVVVRLKGDKVPDGDATPINTVRKGEDWRSLHDSKLQKILLNLDDPRPTAQIASHEFGHVLGLDDRYTDITRAELLRTLHLNRKDIENELSENLAAKISLGHPGYTHNKMNLPDGRVEPQNIVDLAVENRPKPQFVKETVRDWIAAHTNQELRMLSTNEKIEIIKTLASGGSVGKDDDAAIKRIRDSATLSEARAIRQALNLLKL